MKISIEYKNGRWLVNDKRLEDLNECESRFMNDFFREVKIKALDKEICTS